MKASYAKSIWFAATKGMIALNTMRSLDSMAMIANVCGYDGFQSVVIIDTYGAVAAVP